MPVADVAPRLPVREVRSNPGRIFAGLSVIVVAVFLMAQQEAFRVVEARFTAQVIGLVTSGRARSAGNIAYFGIDTHQVNGVMITTLCSTVVLVTPLMVLAGVLLLLPSFRPARIILGLTAAVVLAAVCNLMRYVAAAVALQQWGTTGFNLVHRYGGSLLVIFGFVVAFILLFRIADRPNRHHRRVASGGTT